MKLRIKLRIKSIVLVLALFFMAACKSSGISESVSGNCESALQKDVYKTPRQDLREWIGYYTRIGATKDNGSLHMEFLLYEEGGQFYGYLAVDGYEKTENGSISPRRRMLTTVSVHGEEVYVYFYEEVPIEGFFTFADQLAAFMGTGGGEEAVEAYFGSYSRGDLLFSMKADGENILTTWKKPFSAESEESLAERKFYNWEQQYITCDLLGEADKAAFLAARGVGKEEAPFFTYYNADNRPEIVVYLDEPEAGGTGIYYFYDVTGAVFEQGFGIPACEKEKWTDSRFDVTKYGDTGERGVHDYIENYEYNEQGQITHFQSEGLITGYGTDGGEPFRGTVIEITYSYRDDGTLERKEGFYSDIIFDSCDCTMTSEYDAEERLVHTSGYITHGSTERHYIYSQDNPCPDYGLMLDYAGRVSAYAFIRYTY